MPLYDNYLPRAFNAPPVPGLDRHSEDCVYANDHNATEVCACDGNPWRCAECGIYRMGYPLLNGPRWCDRCFTEAVAAFRRFRRSDEDV